MRETTTTPRTWRDLLQPWAEQYTALITSIDDHCRSLDDKALNALGLATQRPSQTNVWWAAYQVAPIVREAVRQEQYLRHKERKAATTPEASHE